MPRIGAKVSQADIARVLRAVAQSGLRMSVRIAPDGTITLDPVDGSKPAAVDRHRPVDL
jgi:hypothetical protein